MTDFTTVAVFPTRGENSTFSVSKQIMEVELSLDVWEK